MARAESCGYSRVLRRGGRGGAVFSRRAYPSSLAIAITNNIGITAAKTGRLLLVTFDSSSTAGQAAAPRAGAQFLHLCA